MNEQYMRFSLKAVERDKLRRRINQIDESLANPVEEGREWQHRRYALERERAAIVGLMRNYD